MTATIECKCGWQTECDVESRTQAEVIGDRHESQHVLRRAYRHEIKAITLALKGGRA